jgi:hypothetical protein
VLFVSLIAPGQRRSDAGAPPDALTGRLDGAAFPPPIFSPDRPPSRATPPPSSRAPMAATTRPAAIGSSLAPTPWQRQRLRTAPKISRRDEGVALSAVRGLSDWTGLPRHAILLKRMGTGCIHSSFSSN